MGKPKRDYEPLTIQLERDDRDRLAERARANERTLAAEARIAIKRHLRETDLEAALLAERYGT